MKLHYLVAALIGLMACSVPTSTAYEGPAVVRVGFDCTNTAAGDDVIRCLDCGRTWGIEPPDLESDQVEL